MAQGQVVAMPHAPAAPVPVSLADDELQQIHECEKILRFRDEVLSGSHPRIKVPAHVVAASKSGSSEPQKTSSPSAQPPDLSTSKNIISSQTTTSGLVNGHRAMENNAQAFQANGQRPSVGAPANLPGLGAYSNSSASFARDAITPATASQPFDSSPGKPEINPILLQKSDELIKAEIQLQRQRLERALRDDLDQQRAATKNAHAEPLADFDLKEVLTKSLELVQKKTAAPVTDSNLAANASGADSDSFDDNTFYSSRHDTPESVQVSRIPEEPEDVEMQDDSQYEPELDIDTIPTPGDAHAAVVPIPPPPGFDAQAAAHQYLPTAVASQQYTSTNIHLSLGPPAPHGELTRTQAVPLQASSSHESGEASRYGEFRQLDSAQNSVQRRLETVNRQLLDEAFAQQIPPVLRAHNLSPVAPQPAHVSPLATSRQPPIIVDDETAVARATPAQVAALRKDPASASSPESSPQGKPTRKARKKNKRKADRQAADAAASPYIKPEPRSPSPMSAPQMTRPQKRQRRSGQQGQGLDYDEVRYDSQPEGGYQDRSQMRIYREERAPVVYERQEGYYIRPESRPVIVTDPPRYEQGHYDDRRPGEAVQYVRHAQSPALYPTPQAPSEPRIVRSVSHAVVDRPYREAPVYYRDSREIARVSLRPGADRERSRSPIMYDPRQAAMGPPRPPPARVVVDEFGREYMEPPRPVSTIVRPSAPPLSRPGEPEVVYERTAPIRATSRMPGADTFEQDGVVYRRASPTFAAPRRVITQPEYGSNPEFRTYREREYSIRPVPGPGEDYMSNRAPVERRVLEEPPREYITRAASVRPVAEPIRYEVPREYGARPQSVRPEPIPRDYAISVHPDVRREVIHPAPREFSVRPGEPPQIIRREYSVRPVEQPYYERPVRGDEDLAYVERPSQGVIYQGGPPTYR